MAIEQVGQSIWFLTHKVYNDSETVVLYPASVCAALPSQVFKALRRTKIGDTDRESCYPATYSDDPVSTQRGLMR